MKEQPKMRLSDVMRLRRNAYVELESKLNQLPLKVVGELAEKLDVEERLAIEGKNAKFELHFVRRDS